MAVALTAVALSAEGQLKPAVRVVQRFTAKCKTSDTNNSNARTNPHHLHQMQSTFIRRTRSSAVLRMHPQNQTEEIK